MTTGDYDALTISVADNSLHEGQTASSPNNTDTVESVTGDKINISLDEGTKYSVVPPGASDGEITFSTYYSAVAYIPEVVQRGQFGDFEECAECPRSMECMSGSIPEVLKVASTRAEHKEGVTLFCIDEGEVKVVIEEVERPNLDLDNQGILKYKEPAEGPSYYWDSSDYHWDSFTRQYLAKKY